MKEFAKIFRMHPIFLIIIGLLWLTSFLVFANFAKKFAYMGAHARQTEAKVQLKHIYTLQTSFFKDHGRFGSLAGGGCKPNEIGFTQNCDLLKYKYTMTFKGSSNFIVTARERVIDGVRTVFPECVNGLDEWKIDARGKLESVRDAAKNCEAFQGELFKLPPLKFWGIGLGISCLVFFAFCLMDLFSSVFLPPGVSKVSSAVKLALVSLPWIIPGIFLGRLFSTTESQSMIIFATFVSIIVLGSGLIFSRLIVIRNLANDRGKKLTVAFFVPSVLGLFLILFLVVPLF